MTSANSAETRALSSVFIGNVPLDISEEQLKDLFSECGQVVNFKLFFDKAGKSQGFAFCEYKEPEIAVSATRNLGGYDLKGQSLRVDIATSEKCRHELERLQGTIIDSSEASEGTTEKAPEEISKAVASLPAEQMFELMKQMKMCIENNPQEARNLLLQNPQLAYALLQAQVIMRIVDPEVAVKILDRPTGPPENVESDKQNPDPLPVGESDPNFIPGMPPVNPNPMVATSVPQMPQPVPNPHIRPTAMPRQMVPANIFPDQDLRTAGDQDLRQLPPALADRDLRTQQPMAIDKDFRIPMGDQDFRTLPPSTTAPESRPFDPRFRNMPAPDIQRPVAPPFSRSGNVDPRTVYDARNVAAPVRVEDPRRASMSSALHSRLSAAGSALQNLGSAMPPLGAIPGAASMMPEDQEKAALIMQVLQLTEQQIAQLPPEQRTSIMVLKDQLARSQLI